jgi:hypothetical protein
MGNSTFGGRALRFFNELGVRPPVLPAAMADDGVELLNPYREPDVRAVLEVFYRKFYSDNRPRVFVLGINPGRFGGGLTGISFTDPVALRENLGIVSEITGKRELSSEFIYRVVDSYGGAARFFGEVFLTAVCPLGFVRGGVNYNFYDNPALTEAMRPFIAETLRKQAAFGAFRGRAIVLGAGRLTGFIRRLNDELELFDEIIPLEHPRFIMQYRRKTMEEYLARYAEAIGGATAGM